MNKTLLILKQEYLKRVTRKSFIILTLLVPLLFAGMFALMIWLSVKTDNQERLIAVYDASTLFPGALDDDEGFTKFHFIPPVEFEQVKSNLKESEFYALLYIPDNIYSTGTAQLISEKQIPIELTEQIEMKLSSLIESDKRKIIISETGIPDLEDRLAATRTPVKLHTLKVTETGETTKSSSEIAFIASYTMGFLIYFFVFMYGSMVMRSVMEEKKSRIVEVIISSVKPIQLMAGKIIGTALVGLTQVAIWVVIGSVAMMLVPGIMISENAAGMGQSIMENQQYLKNQPSPLADQSILIDTLEMIGNLNIGLIIFSFIFYFLAGYLLYSSLLGAIGAAVDNDEDSQQLVFPITIPLILSIMLLFPIARNPEGPVAFWGSIIPFTSPVAMLARIPYEIPLWELLLSMFLLLITTAGAIWVAAKIYKTGLLLYGKKITLKELIKWIRYNN